MYDCWKWTKPYHGPLVQLRRNEKTHFFSSTKYNVLFPSKMVNSFVNVFIDFLTIIKYRKKDINKIVRTR